MGIFKRRKSGTAKINRAADQARDRGQFLAAADLYRSLLELQPDNGPIHVQVAHMLKEARKLDDAAFYYGAARRLMPDDADLALQRGHFFKLMGRLDEAEGEYRRALALAPNDLDAKRELANLLSWGWRSAYSSEAKAALPALDGSRPGGDDTEVVSRIADEAVLAHELVPEPIHTLMHKHHNDIAIRRLGREERSRWGMISTLRGIEAVRGFFFSEVPIEQVVIRLNGNVIHREVPLGPYLLKYEIEQHRISKFVFNCWIDFSRFEPGRYLIAVEGWSTDGEMRREERAIAIAEPFRPEDHPRSDGIIDVGLLQGLPVESTINALPTGVHPARRGLLLNEPKTILVLRTDQLGDMVAAVPALRRLRALFPHARIVGLLTSGNADFAATLKLFDEIIVISLPDDPLYRHRIMSLEDQAKLKKQLAPYKFDLAIDLADAGVSRPLLLLSGAPVLYGFRDREFTYLTAGQEGNSHDLWNRMECTGHSAQTVSLIGRLEALVRPDVRTVRRDDLSPDRLDRFGLSAGRPYVLLHGGARIEFSRWPGYAELAKRFLSDTDMDVVLMGLEGEARELLPSDLLSADRFHLIEGLLPFDDFDALISFAHVFVGNDSGPKHLASLRGVNVVGLHLARNNWTEWGQEHSGVVLSRKVPCAGCNIYYDGEECGKEFVCLRAITAEEVFKAGMDMLNKQPAPLAIG